MSSIFSENLENLEFLLESGLKIDSVDRYGDNVMNIACKFGTVQQIDLILKYANKKSELAKILEHSDRTGQTPFLQASAAGRIEVLDYLSKKKVNLKAVDIYNNTAIHLASIFAFPKVIEVLLEKYGLDIEARGYSGETPLISTACRAGVDNISNLEYLIFKKANINAIDYFNDTALTKAAWC